MAERAVRAAGDAIMARYAAAAVRRKADGSALTDADLAADRVIRETLRAAFPDDAILTEEGVDDPARLTNPRCWTADPVDGTAAFMRRTGDFDGYVALAVAGSVTVAATLQPATGLLHTAVAGRGAWFTPATGSRRPLRYDAAGAAIRIGTRPWLGAPGNLPLLTAAANRIGSGAVAFVADQGPNVRSFLPPNRRADAVVGLSANGSTIDGWEWDVAAVDLIVREAGGCSTNPDGSPLCFNQPYPRFLDGFAWSADPWTHERVLIALAAERMST